MEFTVLRVKTDSSPNKLASAITGLTKDGEKFYLQCVGNGAIGQATKAVAIANKFVSKEGYKFLAEPEFVDLEIDNKERTGIRIFLTKIEGSAKKEDE